MLDISTPSPPILPPQIPIRHRSRGGQPGNTNAFKHGYYSSRQTHPSRSTLNTLKSLTPTRSSTLDHHLPTPDQQFRLIQRALSLTYTQASNLNDKAWRIHFDQFLRAVQVSCSFKARLIKSQLRQNLLPSLAANARLLYNWEFADLRIRLHPLFVPLRFVKNRGNTPVGRDIDVPVISANIQPSMGARHASPRPLSSPFQPRLTDDQWNLIKDYVSALRAHHQSFKKRRFEPRYDDRFLMDAILWKLALGARWQDLTSDIPIRQCQWLYRALYLSGIFSEIYTALHNHLNEVGQLPLSQLVQQGCFQIRHNRVILSPGQTLTWEKYTALLLLQRSLHNLRKRHNRKIAQRRREGRLNRLSPLPSFHRLHSPRRPPPPPSILFTSTSDSLTTPSSDHFAPIESSSAWQKWQQHEKLEQIIRKKIVSITSNAGLSRNLRSPPIR